MSKLMASPFLRNGAIILASVAAAVFLFPGFVHDLFRSDQFMPHATCYLRNPKVIALHVSSDLLIGLAYVSISSTLAYLVFKASKGIPFHWMFLAFGLFIVSCGFTHFMEVWTVWSPVYWLAGYVKLITAAASVVTAVALFPLVPKIFALINSVKVSEQRRSDLKNAHARLETQKADLELANRELETFNYSVAHDLRAPLRAIQGFSTILQNEYASHLDEKGKGYAQRIAANAVKMDSLLSDLLEYGRISRGGIELSQVDLKTVMNQTVNDLEPQIKNRNARVAVEADDVVVQANSTILVQVLNNLVSNAIKFMPSGRSPAILMQAITIGDVVQIKVTDNGIGIPEPHHAKIFNLFERLHSETEYPGTGIGLAIVQRGVEKMGGRIFVQSQVGQGSTFTIELPKAKV
jgi:signal transduction histidine kinase